MDMLKKTFGVLQFLQDNSRGEPFRAVMEIRGILEEKNLDSSKEYTVSEMVEIFRDMRHELQEQANCHEAHFFKTGDSIELEMSKEIQGTITMLNFLERWVTALSL